jgi:hypothetical protein
MTKGDELRYIRDRLRAYGVPTRTIGCRQVNEFGLSSMVNADHVDFL